MTICKVIRNLFFQNLNTGVYNVYSKCSSVLKDMPIGVKQRQSDRPSCVSSHFCTLIHAIETVTQLIKNVVIVVIVNNFRFIVKRMKLQICDSLASIAGRNDTKNCAVHVPGRISSIPPCLFYCGLQ